MSERQCMKFNLFKKVKGIPNKADARKILANSLYDEVVTGFIETINKGIAESKKTTK